MRSLPPSAYNFILTLGKRFGNVEEDRLDSTESFGHGKINEYLVALTGKFHKNSNRQFCSAEYICFVPIKSVLRQKKSFESHENLFRHPQAPHLFESNNYRFSQLELELKKNQINHS